MSDNVKGGILDLVPTEGARFIHNKWNFIDACRPRDMSRRAMNNASWALSCIRCDEGVGCTLTIWSGWKCVGQLSLVESRTMRHIEMRSSGRGSTAERIQLLINGNLLGARQRNGKLRLQFLGVRLKEPPAGPYNLGDQITELLHDRRTRHEQQWLGPCDGWIRPWLSGQ